MPHIRKRSEQGTYLRAQGWKSRRENTDLSIKTEPSASEDSRNATIGLLVRDQDEAHREQTEPKCDSQPTTDIPRSRNSRDANLTSSVNTEFGPCPRLDFGQEGRSAFTNDAHLVTGRSMSQRGQAILAVLPDGSFTGHMVDRQEKSVLGIMAVDVLPWVECTQGEDWTLVRATLVKQPPGWQEFSFLAEKLGSDALRISAPVNWGGLDPGLRTDVEVPTDREDVHFEFTCHLLETEDKAEERLRRMNQKLCGKDATVNIGNFRVEFCE
eukprot:jgi/Botrbrau1/3129/Bobra.0070s0101.2